jgi:hypothetical protein
MPRLEDAAPRGGDPTRALLATFDLAGFNPSAATWQPATEGMSPVGAPWREDLASRSLLHAP